MPNPIGLYRVHNLGVAPIAVLRLASNVADTETVTIGADVYEFDRAANGVTAGRIAVTAHSDDTPANASTALANKINASGTELVKAVRISANEILIYAADAVGGDPDGSTATTALAETMAGANNAWDTAALRGGQDADYRAAASASRVPNATEVALGNMHFVFPFTVATAVAEVRVTAGGTPKGWVGGVTISGNRVTLDNAGATDWAATDTVTVIAFE